MALIRDEFSTLFIKIETLAYGLGHGGAYAVMAHFSMVRHYGHWARSSVGLSNSIFAQPSTTNIS